MAIEARRRDQETTFEQVEETACIMPRDSRTIVTDASGSPSRRGNDLFKLREFWNALG
jgi:hypothetical protein